MSVAYDYDFQCYVEDGLVMKCGHPADFIGSSGCFACQHAGEPIAKHRRAATFPNDEYTPPESVDPMQRFDENGKLPVFDRLVLCLSRFDVPAEKAGEFMFMGCFNNAGRKVAYATPLSWAQFKHRDTRNSVMVGAAGHVAMLRNSQWVDLGRNGLERSRLSQAFGISFVHAVASSAPPEPYTRQFREEDCGGVFDGFGVISDADPGL